jgi:hypothetical protein
VQPVSKTAVMAISFFIDFLSKEDWWVRRCVMRA